METWPVRGSWRDGAGDDVLQAEGQAAEPGSVGGTVEQSYIARSGISVAEAR